MDVLGSLRCDLGSQWSKFSALTLNRSQPGSRGRFESHKAAHRKHHGRAKMIEGLSTLDEVKGGHID